MICKRVEIDTIPACVWGMASTRVIVAVHGNMASKTDTATAHLAEFAAQAGWQVLSFDLPEHGDRKGRELPCTMPQCVEDTRKIWAYAQRRFVWCEHGRVYRACRDGKRAACLCMATVAHRRDGQDD